MRVFKFGGASVNSIERIQHAAAIIREYSAEERLVIIISAMGKTTNALEKVAEAFYAGKKEEALELFGVIKNQHITTAKYLLVKQYNACYAQLNDFFTEVEWLLHDKPVRDYAYYYDQIVCIGELFSTTIVSFYLQEVDINNTWLDVRDIIRTDNNFRNANIQWTETETRVKQAVEDVDNIVLTQGFIGCTDDNESTTLGREGSDYTAAVFANILGAENLTIWKDVEGVMNADPKEFPEAQLLQTLSFNEVIEMAYYGAQVIHPKTIKPLQNKGIPLLVKCFLDTSLPGTVISSQRVKNLPPIMVVKQHQALIHLRTHDFSFVGEQPMSQLYQVFGQLNITPNLVQSGAISLQICLDNNSDKIEQLATAVSNTFDVQVEKDLTLLTIRHYTPQQAEERTADKNIVLVQKTKETTQVLYYN
ncbi:aspartate kinase [Filimonas lacunae]|uniref:Aspartokinase n=1 Tax=Filimonas lacunae TaxID=477680 RepID=A0A173MLD2_9BACT|nr:aspartate kinase [Filimonas lacunae]BAV08221.1 aspartokinase [Filimonas lacunae]SIT33078.1 aspartate kinase [Filimonas lacunae]